jgi:hypothetical protein
MLRIFLAALLAVALLEAVVLPQQPDTAGILLVTVVDAQNQPTVNLDAADFVVSQGDEPREVFAVRIADYPLVLLLDNGADAAGDLPVIRAAAARFVERIGERAVAVLTLSDPPSVLASFEDDRETVIHRIESMPAAATTARAPLHALGAASEMLREGGAQFSAIVLVSAAPLEAGQTEPTGFLTSFLESRAILHVVTKGASPLPGQTDSEGILRNMAERSGGRHLLIYSTASFQIALDQLADRLGAEMLVEYLTPAGAPRGDVRVGVKMPGARVRGIGVNR